MEIATFTTNLCENFALKFPDVSVIAVAMNDIKDGYFYPQKVRFEIDEKDISSYQRAAEFLNINNIDVVCLQHEYGIFGGKAGNYILTLLKKLHMPVVTTLHTILEKPDPTQKKVLEEIILLSDKVSL